MNKVISKNIAIGVMLIALVLVNFSGCSKKQDSGEELENTQTSTTSETPNIVNVIKESDYYSEWQNDAYTSIKLNGDSLSVEGNGVTYQGTNIIINQQGNYVITGSLSQGSITVSATEKADVRIILNGVTITNNNGPVINVTKADKVMISLVEGTTNTLNDGDDYLLEGDNPNAVIYSTSDLVFNGLGTLVVNANYNDAIHSTDDLRIIEGTYKIKAVDDGMIGKDALSIVQGSFTIDCGGDGLKSTNSEENNKGFIYITNGQFAIVSGDDGLQSETSIIIEGGIIDIQTISNNADSGKGIKAGDSINIKGATITIDSNDDALHSNNTIVINSGILDLQSGDDGIHSDNTLTIESGTIKVADSYEGIEAAIITINGGDIEISASDDGINGAGGDANTTAKISDLLTQYGVGTTTTNDQNFGGRGGMGGSSVGYLFINGGNIYVNSYGDGLDANTAIVQTGGDILIEGPTNSGNGALDYDVAYVMTGGSLLAVGSYGMAQTISENSSVYCFAVTYATTQPVGSKYILKNKDGDVLVDYTSTKMFQTVVYASTKLTSGVDYTLADANSDLMTGQLSAIITSISSTGSPVNLSGGMGGRGNR